MSTPRFDLVGIVVNDMAAALAFYRALGMDIPTEADTEPHVEVTLPGGLRIAWDAVSTIQSFDPDFQPSQGNTMGLAFALDSPGDVDDTYKRLVTAGYTGHKDPWDAFWGQRYAIVHDPDGHGVDLFAPLG
ncbi:VOC family protein [Smaragdicoccus niigatensis]|uniref:VOC family protein n=1 Tax=Smaragdicoccus niigatensis TaxID=359359 RepID=UPI000382D776|nr:VOC family protein [Smaragdicoccus niigatensis]